MLSARTVSMAAVLSMFFALAGPAAATNWYVSPSGVIGNPGTESSPWDIASALTGHGGQVQPGDTIYLLQGTYATPRNETTNPYTSFPVIMRGTAAAPITVRPAPGARVRIDGGLMPGPDSGRRCEYVTIRDLEVFCNEWLTPQYDDGNMTSTTGGVYSYYGTNNKYINMIVHNVRQGFSNWVNDEKAEIYGCSIYGCGWDSADRGHGHAIYSQNRVPTKTIENNILSTLYDGQLSLQAYGSGDANVDNYMVKNNIASKGYLLVGGGGPATNNWVVGNIAYGTPIWAGYVYSHHNISYTVTDNFVVNTDLNIWKVQTLVEANNVSVNGNVITYYTDGNSKIQRTIPRPAQPTVFLFPNKYDDRRANLAIFNWNGSAPVLVDFKGVVPPDANFRLLNPQDFFGTPVFQGTADANGMATVPAPTEFNTYIVMPLVQMINARPQVNAGLDQSISLPTTTVNLSGSVSDDGLPSGAAVTRSWSQVSGPGTVTIANPSASSTQVTLPAVEGTYVLRLTASDTDLTSSDDVAIYIRSSNAVMALHLPLDEGSGMTAGDTSGSGHNGLLIGNPVWTTGKLGGALNFNGTSNYVQVNDFNMGGEFTVAFWFKPAPNSLGPTASGYHYIFSWGNVGGANDVNVWFTTASESDIGIALRTTAMDTNDANAVYVDLKEPSQVTFTDGAWHHYCLTVSPVTGRTIYLDANAKYNDHANGGDAFNPATNIILGGRSNLTNDRFYAGGMDDVRIYEVALTANQVVDLVQGNTNTAPTVSAGPDLTVTAPWGPAAVAVLDGTVSDDGLPTPPAACTYTWSKISGPGTVTFANANAADTTATFSVYGTYVLRLTASDSALSTSDETTVTVQPLSDFSGDGKVNGADFLIWQARYPMTSGATKADGDANGDGKVNGADFLIWQAEYQPM